MDEKMKTKESPAGILRLDLTKTRKFSSDLNKALSSQCEPTSPQPSIDRLSVTFAEDSIKSVLKMDKVQFTQPAENNKVESDDEEDYSTSANAIIQRRASMRKSRRRNSRRASSPFSPDILAGSENGRRRSSVFTTSSGDTAITMDENFVADVSQEEIFENIKLHKEVLSNVKMQPWNMRKKLKLVVQAKNYIKKHEGALQERLAQSRSTRDMLARWNIYILRKWQKYRREMANISMWFIPWELKIKEIESHFGSVVASYFIFLRWLFWVNIVIAVVLISFVAIPEMLTADVNAAGDRKFILPEEKYNSTNFLTLWDFEGVLKYSPLFYGWYTNRDSNNAKGYRLPFAYFITGLMVYAYSFVATLKKMAENSRLSKLSEKDDEYIFTWKLFTAWDFMIGNPETAHNRIASIVMGFKEALVEEAEKKRESRNWRVIGFRVLVNTIVLGLLSFSAFAVIMVVKRSTEPEASTTVWRKNEITIVMSLITLFFPMLFEVLGFLEQYHPRKQLRLQLARIMVLNLLNLYSLIFALFDKISDMTTEGHEFRDKFMRNISHVDEFISNETEIVCCTICTEIVQHNQLQIANMLSELMFNVSNKVSNYSNISELITQSSNNFNGNTSDVYLDFINATISFNETFINDTIKMLINTTFFDDNIYTDDFPDYLTYILNFFNNYTISEEELTNFTEIVTTQLPNLTSDITTLTTLSETVITNQNNCTCPCPSITPTIPIPSITLNYSEKAHLRSLCWETMFGQELVKLTIMDLIMTVLSTLAMDFFRGLFVRYMNSFWCWDLEKKFPQYGDFKVAENILHLVNNQGMVWMGMFFSPGLVVLNVAKLYIMMYLRAWAVLTCNVPHEIIFRASRSNNFYYALLLMMLFLCVLPVGYAIVWVRPSWNCGPFSRYDRIFHIFTTTIRSNIPKWMQKALDYIVSPSIVIPLLVLLILIIYYLVSLTGALREANSDLKIQLRRERTEERRKMFQIVDRRNKSGNMNELPMDTFGKWKKILATLPGKSFDDKGESDELPQTTPPTKEEKNDKTSVFLSKFIRKALRMQSTTDEEQNNDEATDTDQQDSLPEDVNTQTLHRNPSNCSSDIQMNVFRAWSSRTKPAKNEIESSNEPVAIQKTNQLNRQDTFELKRNSCLKKRPSVPIIVKRNLTQQDSQSSVRSENIPVIRISKSESVENIFEETSVGRKTNKLMKQEEVDDNVKDNNQTSDTDDTDKDGNSMETVLQINKNNVNKESE